MSDCLFYHQCGHNDVWNRNLFEEDIGYGLIISPVNMSREKVEALSTNIKKVSFFDPQFYLPTSSRPRLETYSFHPTVIFTEGHDTTTYLEDYSYDQATACVKFQVEQNFAGIIVPARHCETFGASFKRFNGTIYSRFLNACEELKVDKPIYLTLPLHYSMLSENSVVDDILNWITSYENNDGIYLLCERPISPKQIKNSDLIETLLDICYYIKKNDLSLMVGYCNTEGLIYSLADADIIASGAYENVRMFSIDRWREPVERTGPRGRYYSPYLLNWIDSGYIGTLRRRKLLPSIEFSNEYS
jgi:hypothetical protein